MKSVRAINLNNRDYYVTGVTHWDDGRVHRFDDWEREPIVCPQTTRCGPEVKVEDCRNKRLPKGHIGYTVTILSCVKITAAEHEIELERTEEHCARILEEL